MRIATRFAKTHHLTPLFNDNGTFENMPSTPLSFFRFPLNIAETPVIKSAPQEKGMLFINCIIRWDYIVTLVTYQEPSKKISSFKKQVFYRRLPIRFENFRTANNEVFMFAKENGLCCFRTKEKPLKTQCLQGFMLVGVTGFEPTTPTSRT